MQKSRGYWSDSSFAKFAANSQDQSFGDTFVVTIQYACKKIGLPYSDYERIVKSSIEYLETVNKLKTA
jgi:hypothetical protein